MDEELQQCGEELLHEVEGLLDHDYSPVIAQIPLYKRPRVDNDVSRYISSANHMRGGDMLRSKPNVIFSNANKKYIEPPLDDVWPPPNLGEQQKTFRMMDKLESLTNELKINISDAEGTKTVLIKMPHEK